MHSTGIYIYSVAFLFSVLAGWGGKPTPIFRQPFIIKAKHKKQNQTKTFKLKSQSLGTEIT